MTNKTRNKIAQLVNLEELNNAQDLIEASPTNPFQFLARAKNADSKGYAFFKLSEAFKDSLSKIYVVPENKKMGGLVSLKSLPWDEQIFKIKMASVSFLLTRGNYEEKKGTASKLICHIFEECHANGIEHVSVRIDSRDIATIHALEESGFNLMDILAYSLLNMNTFTPGQTEAPFKLRESIEADVEEIVKAARIGFHDYIDRFHIDPHLAQQHCDDLYAEWARNSCHGYADKVFVAEMDNTIIGVATAKIHRDAEEHANVRLGEIEFGCVLPKYQGLGVFSKLVDCCLNWMKTNTDMVFIKTLANNFQTQQIFQNCGFKPTQTQCTLHKWLNKGKEHNSRMIKEEVS